MAAKIYLPPKDVKVPQLDFSNFGEYRKQCDVFIKELRDYVIDYNYNKTDGYIGEVIRFQVADGYAEYMIGSLKPLMLIHIPIMDEYTSQFAHLMTVKSVKEMVGNNNKMKQIFGKK